MVLSSSNIKKIPYILSKESFPQILSKESFPYISKNGTLHFPFQTPPKTKKTHRKNIPYISRNGKLSSSNIFLYCPKRKLFLYFQKRNFLALILKKFPHFLKRNYFLYLPKWNPALFSPSLKNKRTAPRENLLCFRKQKPWKNPYILGNGNSKKASYISGGNL